MTDRFENVTKTFPSLEECVSYAQENYGEDQFLFRGERSDRFLTTISMLERVRSDQKIHPQCRARIEERVQWLHRDLKKFLKLPAWLAKGFLQHYGVPTDLLDLTSSPTIAAYFAAGGPIGSDGLFAVIPRHQRPGLVDLRDLRWHPIANRAQRQSAFTFSSKKFRDLKSEECISELSVRWFRFTLQESDKALYAARDDFLDPHTDKVAGVIQLLLDDYGKTDDWTAQWLADHVAVAPFITSIVTRDKKGRPVDVELTAAEDAGFDYDVVLERVNNHRIWSCHFPDTRGHGGFANLRPRPSSDC